MAEPDALGKESYIFSAGGPVWALDWCPVPSSSSTQYMAISALRDIEDQPAIGTRRSSDELGGIQIWSFDPAKAVPARCEIVLCIKGAGVLDLKWMPLGARDNVGFRDAVTGMKLIVAGRLDSGVAEAWGHRGRTAGRLSGVLPRPTTRNSTIGQPHT